MRDCRLHSFWFASDAKTTGMMATLVCVWAGRGDREREIEGRLINVSICQ